jgi:two-component system LytT family response regulator
MSISCVIVEDEPLARKLMEDYVTSTPGLDLKGSFGNPLEALEYMRENPCDLLFSDIRMKEISGIALLKLLSHKPFVILTTAYSEYAIESFELDVTDYLLKPITFERFLKSVEKVNLRIKEKEKGIIPAADDSQVPLMMKPEDDSYFFKDGSKLLKIKLSDILYIQGLKDYVKVVTKDRQIVSLQTMKSLEENLPSNRFIRIHNSTIVAFDAIEEVERDRVKIGKNYFVVSDSYKKDFKDFVDGKRM